MHSRLTWRTVLLTILMVVLGSSVFVAIGQSKARPQAERVEAPRVSQQATPLAYPPPATPTPARRLAYPGPVTPTPRTTLLTPRPTPTPLPPWPTPTPDPGPSQQALAARAYIAQREGISEEVLRIAADYPINYPLQGRRFQYVVLSDPRPNGDLYKVMVDLQDGRIEEDLAAVQDAEAQAHVARYGKFDQALYERLQSVDEEELLPVAVWLAAGPGQSLAERELAATEAVAARYPEARAALDKGHSPWNVKDPALSKQIHREYRELLDQAMSSRGAPLLAELRERGFELESYEGMPSFTAKLPKRVILELAERQDVTALYLVRETKPA